MKQRFFFCFGLSSDLSCSSGVGSAFSDTEADIKNVNKNSGEKKSCLSPFKSYKNLNPMLYIWPFCCSSHVWSAMVSPQQLKLPPSRPSIQLKKRTHKMLENNTKTTTRTVNIRFNSNIQHCQVQEENPTSQVFSPQCCLPSSQNLLARSTL